MACAGAITSIVMTAASTFVANGGFDGLLGDAPIAAGGDAVGIGINDTFSQVSADLGTTISQTVSPTLSTVTSATGTIASQPWYSATINSLKSTLNDIANFPVELRSAWNTMAEDIGNEAVFATFDIFGTDAAWALGASVTAATNQVLDYGIQWTAQSLGGTVAGDLAASVITGDPSKFGSILSAAESYVTFADNLIAAAENAESYLNETFTGLENVITASIEGVNASFENFGEEIAKLGNTVSWENLSNLGSPGQLLANIDLGGTLGPLYNKLGTIEVDEQTARAIGANVTNAVVRRIESRDTGRITLAELGIDINQIARTGGALPEAFQQEVYNTVAGLTQQEVAEIKAILGNTQDAVQTGADLLDPKKLFPNSFRSLTVPTRTASVGFRAIYLDDNGTVNSELANLGSNLQNIIPADLAVANGALSRSLQQVKGINNTNTESLATAVSSLETLKDLPLLKNQTTYVDPNVINFWRTQYGVQSNEEFSVELGTGTNGQIRLQDMLGYSGGYNAAGPLAMNATLLQELSNEGYLDVLTADNGSGSSSTGLFAVIRYFNLGTYTTNDGFEPPTKWTITIPPGVYGQGVYEGDTEAEAIAGAWLNGLIPAAKQLMRDLWNTDPRFQIIQKNTNLYQQQLAREKLLRERIDLDTTVIRATDQTAINLAERLTDIGKDTSAGGTAEYLERIVNYNSLGGQATIAAMREGRNIERISNANLQQDAALSTERVDTPGLLLSSQYTQEEANNNLIT